MVSKARISCFFAFSIALVTLFWACAAHASAASPTVTTLAISSGGQAATSVAAGSVVTLTATVSTGTTPVTVGQVKFCDAAVSYCTDIHLLGVAQLTHAGTTVFKFVPSVGSHSYKAVFVGTKNAAPSTSATGTLAVTGLSPSITTFIPSDDPSILTLTATVGGSASAPPTGAVSFLNASNGNAVLGTSTLGAGTTGLSFLDAGIQYAAFAGAAVGDFNGDGLLDIVGGAPDIIEPGVSIDAIAAAMLGDGNGNFKVAAATADLGKTTAVAPVAVGDFNGDGILDVAVGVSQTSQGLYATNIVILLGKGDGTFSVGQSVATGGDFSSFVVADFNGDGVPDLAVLNNTADLVTMFQGNGDGTFTASSAAPSPTGVYPLVMAAGDFNGDGIPDLVITSGNTAANSTLTILLGKGDGSFTAGWSTAIRGCITPGYVTGGDFNGDGKLDVVAGSGNGATILLGNGDGTFSPAAGSPITITTTGSGGQVLVMSPIAVGDFNGDGKLDILLNDQSVLLGNGDGTFAAVTSNIVEPPYYDLSSQGFTILPALGDFNGDGMTDLAYSTVVLLAATETATATVNGVVVAPGTGSQLIAASYTGDINYKASVSGTIKQTATRGTPTVNVAASANPAPFGSSVTLTATVTGSGLPPTGTVTFYNGSAQLGTGQLNSSGVASFATSALPVGSDSITASYGGDANYIVTSSAPLVVTVIAVGTTTSTVTVTSSSNSITTSQALTVAVAVSGAAGSPTPTGTVTLAGGSFTAQQPLSGGATSFTVAAGTLTSGVNTLTATYIGDGTYAGGSGTTTVTVAAVAIGVSAPSPVSPGANASATVTVTAASTYSGMIQLSCALTSFPAGAQSQPACSLNPASATLTSGGSGTSALTVTTTAAIKTSFADPSRKNVWGLGGGGAFLALLVMCGIPSRRRQWKSMPAPLCVVVALIAIGCGSSHGQSAPPAPNTSATTAGKYTFTVTGKDSANAAIATSTTVTVTVQ